MPANPHPRPNSLSTLSDRLARHLGCPVPGGYRRVWHFAASGQLPMLERHANRWYFKDGDLDAIGRILGMEPTLDKKRKAA